MLLFFFESPAVKLGTQCGPDWNLALHKSSATRWWIGGRKSKFTFLQPPWHKQRDVFWIVRVSLRKRGLGKRRPYSLQDRTDPAFRSAFIQHELSLVALSYLWIDDWHSWPLLPRGWDALRKSQSCVFIQLLYILKWALAPLHTRYLCFCRPDQETNAIWSQSAWRNLMSCCDRNCILLHGHYSLSSCLRLDTHLNPCCRMARCSLQKVCFLLMLCFTAVIWYVWPLSLHVLWNVLKPIFFIDFHAHLSTCPGRGVKLII